jgi:hypothetical protein
VTAVVDVPVAVVPPAGWEVSALCAQSDPELWFPEKGGSSREAKRACRRCPVRIDCLAGAMLREGDDGRTARLGIEGGFTGRQRVALFLADPDAWATRQSASAAARRACDADDAAAQRTPPRNGGAGAAS